MTLIIIDPNLDDDHGHHLGWDMAIASAATRNGVPARIYANRRCALQLGGVELIPHFTHTTYERHSADPFSGSYEDFQHFNAIIEEELRALPQADFQPDDIVLVPTVSENHLLGYVRWMASFAASAAPRFIIHLMLPSGISVAREEIRVVDPTRALFYRLAFRAAAESGARIDFFGGGRQIAGEFTALSSSLIPPYAIPLAPKPTSRNGNRARPSALLFAGDAKRDKGFFLVPDLAKALCAAHPEWDFVVHANTAIGGEDVRQAFAELEKAAGTHSNLTVRDGHLHEHAYRSLLESSDCMVFTYDPVAYAGKSSAILWECVSLGTPVLIPRETWLENEAALWGAGCTLYEIHAVSPIVAGFVEMCRDIGAMRAKGAAASEKYRAANGPEKLWEQLTGAFPATEWAASLPRREGELCVVVGRTIARADSPRLVHRDANEHTRFLDIAVHSVTAGFDSWPRLKFKLLVNANGPLLEFRRKPAWPEIFSTWPSQDSDRFGPVLRLHADGQKLRTLFSTWQDAKDRRLVAAVAALLPEIVASVLESTAGNTAERKQWLVDANGMGESLRQVLAELGQAGAAHKNGRTADSH